MWGRSGAVLNVTLRNGRREADSTDVENEVMLRGTGGGGWRKLGGLGRDDTYGVDSIGLSVELRGGLNSSIDDVASIELSEMLGSLSFVVMFSLVGALSLLVLLCVERS